MIDIRSHNDTRWHFILYWFCGEFLRLCFDSSHYIGVASVSQAFSSLAEAAYDSADTGDDNAEPPTYCLSTYFEPIIEKLIQTTDR